MASSPTTYRVIVASRNPVKINAVKLGFTKMFPQKSIECIGKNVPTGVDEQPKSNKETFQGAMNRARNARHEFPEADYWVGVEGGISVDEDEQMSAFAWVIVLSEDKIGKGKTGAFYLPKPIASLIKEGKELGEADDIIFGKTNSKQKQGAVGLLTGEVINRASYYTEAVILALIPFKNPQLY